MSKYGALANGDEKIDIFDQVLIKNRLTDASQDILFAGVAHVWQPSETRSMVRAYAPHFLQKSTYQWDPTDTNYPKRTLVVVDREGKAVEERADASDLTLADTEVLDLIDDEHLPPRYYDQQTGQPLMHKEGRITGIDPRRERGGRTLVKQDAEWNRPEGQEGLAEAAEVAAQVEV